MRLQEIGFYTLSDERCQHSSSTSPLWRCELILTDRCNFRCPYCRGLREDLRGTLSFEQAAEVVRLWLSQGLRNVRFSGGEPTIWHRLDELVAMCRDGGVEHIAISTNGSASQELYTKLLSAGANDFSVSLDGACCAVGDKMAGVAGAWPKVVENIRWLAQRTYVTVGMVFTEANVGQCVQAVLFADSLGVADIRVIPSAQYNEALMQLTKLPDELLNRHPILKYRIEHVRSGRHVRGMSETDSRHCWLALDDMAVANGYHFPCIIYMREGGDPIGRVGPDMREERRRWVSEHDTHGDAICRRNCLDVCVDYCNKRQAFEDAKA